MYIYQIQRRSTLTLTIVLALWTVPAAADKIACVGDSITYGWQLNDRDTESYPAILQTLVGEDHTVRNFGVSGATLLQNGDRPYVQESLYTESDRFDPDIVVVMLGSNDAKSKNWSNSGGFESDYLELIEHYRSLGATVYVATPPTVFNTGAFGIQPKVIAEEIVPLVRLLAAKAQAPLVDVFNATSEMGELFPDNVHPDAGGTRLIAETVKDALDREGFDGTALPGTGGAESGAGGSIATGGNTSTGGLGSGGDGGLKDVTNGNGDREASGGDASSESGTGASQGGPVTGDSLDVEAGDAPTQNDASCQFGGSSDSSGKIFLLGLMTCLFIRVRRSRSRFDEVFN